PLRGFVAPAWLLGDGAWHALRRQPFDYTCTRRALVTLPHGHPQAPSHTLRSRSIVYSTRAAWRRAASLPYNRMVAHLEHDNDWVRFELHPSDIVHGAVWRDALRLIERALAQGRPTLTLGAVADQLLTRAGAAVN